jgi:hypothetical protein
MGALSWCRVSGRAHQWRTVPDAGGPRLFKIAQAVSGLPDRREFGSQSRSFFSREGRR